MEALILHKNYKRFDSFSSIANLIEKVSKKRLSKNFTNKFIEHKVISNWEQIVGSQIAPYTEPKFLKGYNLYIATITSVWATELSFMKDALMDKINDFLRTKGVKNIFFSVGDVYKPINKSIGNFDLDNVEIDNNQKEIIKNALGDLNGEVKDILSRIMIKSLKRSKLKNELNHKE